MATKKIKKVKRVKQMEVDAADRVLALLVVLAVTIFLGLVVVGLKRRMIFRQVIKEQVARPRVEELFACGDYCPGAADQYRKQVYSGVKSETECRAYGGSWGFFIGLGKTFYCEVE